jgi:TrmH family RNA methyltransferase
VVSKEEIKRLRTYHSAKGRQQYGVFIAEGEKVVSELLSSDVEVQKVYYVVGFKPQNEKPGVQMTEVSEAEMGRITQFHSPSPVAAVAVIPQQVQFPGGTRLVYLDRISDPGNAGTIIRLCHWFGIDAVLMSEGSVEKWNPKVVQASMGSVFKIPVAQNVNANDIKGLKSKGFSVIGTHLNGNDVRKWNPVENTVLVLGNESQGINGQLVEACSNLVKIPGQGGAESLNVAAAAAIVLYEWNNKI